MWWRLNSHESWHPLGCCASQLCALHPVHQGRDGEQAEGWGKAGLVQGFQLWQGLMVKLHLGEFNSAWLVLGCRLNPEMEDDLTVFLWLG